MSTGTREPAAVSEPFRPDEDRALELDAQDELASFRSRFRIPLQDDGRPVIYLCGNSLGLQPIDAPSLVQEELEAWGRLGVEAHFKEDTPWYSYHELFREPAARLVGALPGEAVMMNGLTVNLHLMFVSFYRPTAERHKILIEAGAFPSDDYAVQTQLRYHGYEPEEALLLLEPRPGESGIRTDDIEELLERRGREVALVFLGGVNYYTGQLFDMRRITARARELGCVVGYDLAHAAGNVPLRLHDWGIDFAVWCSYKYLNAGPGAVAGCFVHERHSARTGLPRFAGWWGNDPARRFRMHEERIFRPVPGAEGWQLSNPPILSMAPLRASLRIFEQAGMDRLRAKSLRLTRYLEQWVERAGKSRLRSLTPRDPEARGCQLSLFAEKRPQELMEKLRAAGVRADYREPGVIRVAPVPLYNSFHDVWRFGRALEAAG